MEIENPDFKYFVKGKISHWNANADLIITRLKKNEFCDFWHIKQLPDDITGPKYQLNKGTINLAVERKAILRSVKDPNKKVTYIIWNKLGKHELNSNFDVLTKEELFAQCLKEKMNILELVELAEDADDYEPQEPMVYHKQSVIEKRNLCELIQQMEKGDELTFTLHTWPDHEEIAMYYVCIETNQLKHFHLDKDHMARIWNQYIIHCDELKPIDENLLAPTGFSNYIKSLQKYYDIDEITDLKIRHNRFTENEIDQLINNKPVNYDLICERNPLLDPAAYIQYIIKKYKTNSLITTLEKSAQHFIWYGKWGREAARTCRGLARQAEKQKKRGNTTFHIMQGMTHVYKMYPRKTIKSVLMVLDDVLRVEFPEEIVQNNGLKRLEKE